MDIEAYHSSMVLFQEQRRLELWRYAHGDRTVEGPATPLQDNWWTPAPKLNPMADAPRGQLVHVRLFRRERPNMRYPAVTAYYSPTQRCWIGPHHLVIRDDDNLLGWMPVGI